METDHIISNIRHAMLNSIPVEHIGLSRRILNVINHHEYNPTLGWLTQKAQSCDILKWRNLGIKGFNEIRVKCGLPEASSLFEAWRIKSAIHETDSPMRETATDRLHAVATDPPT